jgi:hypothetical protein
VKVRAAPTLLVVAFSGCAAAAPVIDDVQMPQTASSEGAGYALKGVISFHHDGGTVRKVRIQLGQEVQDFETAASLRRATAPLEIRFARTAPKGQLEYLVSLVDEAGVVSDARRLVVLLR